VCGQSVAGAWVAVGLNEKARNAARLARQPKIVARIAEWPTINLFGKPEQSAEFEPRRSTGPVGNDNGDSRE
jgi:hypothetical protein